MARNYLIGERDYNCIQEIMRWWYRNKNFANKFRQHRYQSGSATASLKLVKVIRSLRYADDTSDPEDMPVAGFDDYVCRDITSSYSDWLDSTEYLVDQSVLGEPEFDLDTKDRLYVCIAPHTATALTKPDSGANWETVWTRSTEIQPTALAAESETVDLRDYIPWFAVDDIVPIIQRSDIWYFDQTLTRVGAANECSLRWNQDDNRAMAVFK